MELLHTSSSLCILLFQILFGTSLASPYCAPSACGTITNISHPFRLKTDPNHCGDRSFELECKNGVASLSQKYYVKEINYQNSTIRLADASINNTTCSFPNSSMYQSFPGYGFLYQITTTFNSPVNLLSCPYPLENSSLFTHNFTHCATAYSNSSYPKPKYSYIKVGHIKASEVQERCGVDAIVMTSWKFKDVNNATLSEIHHSMLYGIEAIFCLDCRGSWTPWGKNWDRFMLFFNPAVFGNIFNGAHWRHPILLVILPAGVMFAVVCPVLTFCILSLLLLCATYAFSIGYLRYGYYQLDFAQLGLAFTLLGPRFIIFPIALWILIYKFQRRHLSVYNIIESFLQSDNKLTPIRYSYSDIKKMTRGFKEKIGEGGYGFVYKGKLKSGRDVAVKLLRKSGANDQDFTNEISTIGRIHHVNVVTLVGYCAQGSKRALIFDFMPNGSLEKYLFNRERTSSLNLDIKFEIAIGVARGIEYLHRGCDVQILHFDIKPHNVLLDDKFVPRISDFGLAKFYSIEKDTMTMTTARGTIGYVAPELINRSIGAVSYKADVYSFGMLLMEMVSLNKDLSGNKADSNLYFPYWIYDRFNQGKDIEIEDDDYDKDESMRKLVTKMTIVALWCIQMSPDDRPSMNKVLEMLEGNVERLHVPNYPSQSTQTIVNMDKSWSTYSTDYTDSVALLSSNDVSSYVEINVKE